MYKNETIVALATPPGVGAVAIIRISGPGAHVIAGKLFSKTARGALLNELSVLKARTVYLGYIIDNTTVIDQVLLTKFVAPNSYTGENIVEISCHGSIFIQNRIIALCIEQGARAAQPGEFTLQAFINGKMDLSQAEAVADLIASESRTAHQMAMQQMRGGFTNDIKELRTQLLNFCSLIELELDFSEEDVAFANRDELKQLLAAAQQKLKNLLDSFSVGNVLKKGIPVAIVGEPNVGKSTLLNALLNEDKAIVSDIAGTTRDSIEDEVNIDGIRFRFIDTAGIRETTDTIETMGIKRSYDKANQSNLILYLVDATQLLTKPRVQHCILRMELMKEKFSGKKVFLLLNKLDQINGIQLTEIQERFAALKFQNPVIALSAKSHSGLDKLKQSLVASFNSGLLQSGEDVVSNGRHYDALLNAYNSLLEVQEGIKNDISSEFLAIDLKATTEALGLITGEITNDELLGNIFSQFCIGK
ncbi:MAG: tRNA uridine-5-carboxymethylaminomethyl(34) synthesis GTPase MnmE [Nonlabens sp.]